MSRLKKLSKDHENASKRLAGLKSIDAALDLGNGLTVTAYQSAHDAVQMVIDDYNQLLSTVDGKANELKEKEKTLRDYSERMLAGVAAKYGKNSNEYEKAGGTKKSKKRTSLHRVPKVPA